MKYIIGLTLILLFSSINSYSQVSGNITYQNNTDYSSYKKQQIELATGNSYLSDNTFLIEANVLINAKADEYIVTFSLNEDGKTIEEANQRIEKKVSSFINELSTIGITKSNLFVDFIAQNKIYGYDLNDQIPKNAVVKEHLIGFEVKKNILIRYKTEELLSKITLLAAKSDIYDLVKVDYIVSDIKAIREKLFDEAVRIINKKETDLTSKLGLKISSTKQIYAIKYKVLTPSESYQTYQASESNEVIPNYYREYTLQSARKNKTFFYSPLDSNDFDLVINPVTTQPVVQYTILLKVKYKTDN
jgi:uncharacterized protein YggE